MECPLSTEFTESAQSTHHVDAPQYEQHKLIYGSQLWSLDLLINGLPLRATNFLVFKDSPTMRRRSSVIRLVHFLE
ncbi:hypothetical protein NHQ30_011163 [Ciborinia camelliae]|nr:hypothetical protein NHQ30_011163 [Ciborinia camelliae]